MTTALDTESAVPDRREAIADAAIRIVARDGLRSLTHRAVDRELELPTGSTSYYVRTRRQLMELVVRRLAGRTRSDLAGRPPAPEPADDPDARAIQAMTALIERLASRPDDQLTRFALAVDLHTDPDLHRFITSGSPIREEMMAGARAVVAATGVEDVDGAARGLMVLADALVFDRLAGSGVDEGQRADPALVLGAYLTGLRSSASRAEG